MGPDAERERLRAIALHLDRYRAPIEAEVDRRLGRAEPAPEARAEIVRRFRSFCRLASVDPGMARPSLEGLAGQSCDGLENAVRIATEAATLCGLDPQEAELLGALCQRFRAGIRRQLRPEDLEPSTPGARERRKRANAGKRVRAAIDRIDDAYLALNLEDGRIFDLNPAAEALLGAEANALLDHEFSDWIAATDRDRYESLEARLDAGESAPPTRLRFRRQSGEPVSAEVSIASHTIAGRRLAILVARPAGEAPAERLPYSTRSSLSAGILAISTATARSR
jgi:PAS domain S-box-containing protein